jgi:hypothetical protein
LLGVNPGVYVNAKMLLNSVLLGHQSETILATMEDVIDTCTQGGSIEAMKAIRSQARAMIEAVVASGVPIDRALWESRRPPGIEPQPPLIEGPLTRLIEHVQLKVGQGLKLLSAWAQTIHEVPPTLEAYRSNAADYAKMVKVLKDLRFESYQLHEAEVAGEKVDWPAFHAMVLDLVTPEQLGLFALVVHETPTTMSKKVTDGLLWNKAIFPHYLAALTKP